MRAALASRYERLLLDEFQDTDPIQIELAVLIASDDQPLRRWRTGGRSRPTRARLFVVGDPKQSIYRFRRADIAMFLKARDELVGSSEPLTRNFRTWPPNRRLGQRDIRVTDTRSAASRSPPTYR